MRGIAEISAGRWSREFNRSEITEYTVVVTALVLGTVRFRSGDVTEVKVVIRQVKNVDGLARARHILDGGWLGGDEVFGNRWNVCKVV